jgi:hypothetical protein
MSKKCKWCDVELTSQLEVDKGLCMSCWNDEYNGVVRNPGVKVVEVVRVVNGGLFSPRKEELRKKLGDLEQTLKLAHLQLRAKEEEIEELNGSVAFLNRSLIETQVAVVHEKREVAAVLSNAQERYGALDELMQTANITTDDVKGYVAGAQGKTVSRPDNISDQKKKDTVSIATTSVKKPKSSKASKAGRANQSGKAK